MIGRIRFKGIGVCADGYRVNFNNEDGYNKLDGYKLDQIVFAANLGSEQEIEELIDFLEIARFTMSHQDKDEKRKLKPIKIELL